MSEYRIDYSIQRRDDDADDEFVEIGFGSSGFWGDIYAALYAIQSDIQNYQWETDTGMPDPDEIKAEMEVDR